MKYWTMVFIGWLSLSAAVVASPIDVTVKVSALREDASADVPGRVQERPSYVVRYLVAVRNRGTQPIRIPTAGFRQPTEAGPTYTKTGFVWDLETDEHGITTVVSEVELKPVVLRPNEVTLIRASETIHDLSRLNDVQFRLQVSEAFAKRYDLWAGEVVVTHVQVYRQGKKES